MSNTLSEEEKGRISYLKIHFIYEMGRDRKVRTFGEQAGILRAIDEIGSSKQRFILFNRYMEALVAYHRFYGGKD